MRAEEFRQSLLAYFSEFSRTLSTDAGDWVVKGFIDVYRNVYTISVDTKVVSKIIELMLFPVISRFAAAHGYRMVLSEHQNHYPDISFIAADESKFALDLKSTYRTQGQMVNGFTLGAFTGYFRQRRSTKNITFPYEQYAAHFVLGIIYGRRDEAVDERRVYKLDDLQNIVSVVKDFTFLLQEKWRIASDRPGSGNTKNIGSVRDIHALVEGNGPFAAHGQEVFDDYWMNYLTDDMARAIDSDVPYRNLEEYWTWRDRASRKR
ncbi:MAG: restriction endonuclease [Planctomycetes bacterium]|nr:restriction endonuclease [Planctomycetota bacterium]MBM4085497.1 restriction endonuclease [Planctomycetota bacterium]